MSMKIYRQAIETLKEIRNLRCGSVHSEQVIARAEKLLKIKFSPQERDYLSNFGYFELFGVELYGIVDEDFSMDKNSYEGCMVEWALSEREKNNLNHNYIPLRFGDDGEMIFLDHSCLNDEGEPRTIIGTDNGNGYVFTEELTNDLGEYLLWVADEEG